MTYIDVHAHLEHEKFTHDLDNVILDAKNVGLKYIITSATIYEDYERVIEIAKKYDICMASCGLNPIEALKNNKYIVSFFEFTKKHQNEIVAIGEIGIDLHWEPDKEEEQKKIFSDILDHIIPYKKPIVLHTRSAHRIVYDIISELEISDVVWHCYGGSLSLAKKIVAHGMYISIPTSACRTKRHDKFIRDLPLENILTETDAPYQSIDVVIRNEPKFIPKLVKKIAELRSMNETEVEAKILKNFESLFLK